MTVLEKEEQVEDWKGIYDCTKETEDKLVCKKQGLHVFIYVLRDGMKKLSFESVCSPEGWGCNLETEEQHKVDFFQGSFDGYEGDLCQLDKIPETFQLNKKFGADMNTGMESAPSGDFSVKILKEDYSAPCCVSRQLSMKQGIN